MSRLYLRLLIWLHRFEEQPNYSRPMAGLYALLWSHWCGYGWKFAWRQGMIYWRTERLTVEGG